MPYKNIERRREAMRDYYQRNKHKWVEYGKEYRDRPEVKAQRSERGKQRYTENKESILAQRREREKISPRRLRQYGLTAEDYKAILESQNNKCAICEAEETYVIANKDFPLVVDHIHETNTVRGLLCSHCNLMVGFSRDSVENLQRGIDYLNEQS